MPDLKKPYAAAFIIVSIAAFIFLMAHTKGPREPVYRNRPLTYWLRPMSGLPLSFSRNRDRDIEYREAQRAVEALGTNSIPFVLSLYSRSPSELKVKANHILARQSLIGFRFEREPDYPELAQGVLLSLKPGCYVAIPDLVKLLGTENEKEAISVSFTLWYMLPESAPALIAALTNGDKRIRAGAANSMVGHKGASTAISALKATLQDKAVEVRLSAAIALSSLWEPHAQDLTIPVFIQCLSEPSWKTRSTAIRALDSYGTGSEATKSRLMGALNDVNEVVRREAKDALSHIDEQRARKVVGQ